MTKEPSTDYVVSLSDEISKTLRRIDELEWEGDFKTADFAKYHLDYLRKLEANGEVHYPLF